MKIASDLFWYRARHWQFGLAVAGLVGSASAFILYSAGYLEDADGVTIIGIILLATVYYLEFKSDPDQKPDERQLREIDLDNTAYLAPIAALSIIGASWFSLSNYLSTIWLPKSPEDWSAIVWLLFSIGAASKLMNQRLRSLPLLNEEDEI